MEILGSLKKYRAKWPGHKGCLVIGHDGTPRPVAYKGNAGLKLYTGPHTLNMVPHDGGPCPVNADQSVVVQYRNGRYNISLRSEDFLWSHEDDSYDIMYYCPVDPIKVDI